MNDVPQVTSVFRNVHVDICGELRVPNDVVVWTKAVDLGGIY